MRFVLGFMTGVAAVWTALAIWQRVPPFPDLEPDGDPDTTDGVTR